MSRPVAAAQRVVLHVGAPKSGTTYLQRVLWRRVPQVLPRFEATTRTGMRA